MVKKAQAKAKLRPAAAAARKSYSAPTPAKQAALDQEAALAAVAERDAAERKELARVQQARHGELVADHDALAGKFATLKKNLAAAVKGAKTDGGQVAQAAAFVRHGHAIVDEWLAWIERNPAAAQEASSETRKRSPRR